MDYKKIYAIKANNEKRIAKLCHNINNYSGIYTFTRQDELGIKYAYVGQAKHLLKRTAEHLSGYQHIDFSIKKHGLYDDQKKPFGWKLKIECLCDTADLDKMEQIAILNYANKGFQLRNSTAGGQKDGKKTINDYGRKGYLQGKKDGYRKAAKEIATIIVKYTTGLKSSGGKISDRKTAELKKILEEIYEKK